ncbi:MAG: hypothetical protein D4S01_11190 [Dehalococcoidia bacterium]|nr:MAG: hypothetical protein D4S01_11190 [Dehalococcoidia bacterium]
MARSFFISVFVVVLFASNAFAGLGSFYNNPQSSGSIVAPIQIKDKGIYNLVVSIHFLKEPYNNKIYKSDAYEKLINRLTVEWSGVALQQILEAKEQNINDLTVLKSNIEKAIVSLADKLKNSYSLEKNTEVVFSLSNFFLLTPKDND